MAAVDILNTLEDLKEDEFETFKWYLQQPDILEGYPTIKVSVLEKAKKWTTVDLMMKTYKPDGALEMTKKVLEKIKRNKPVQSLSDTSSGPGASVDVNDVGETSENRGTCSSQSEDVIVPVPEQQPISYYQQLLKSNLKDTFMCAQEGWKQKKDEQHLDDIYTELYITAGALEEKPAGTIKPCDMFKLPSGRYKPIRTVLTNGIAGIGKTFLVRKFVLDWAEGRANEDVHLIFPFTFRQLNLRKEKTSCLAELIHECIIETRDIKDEVLNHIFTTLQSSGKTYDKSKFKLLFVLDGLDESRLQLDCSTSEKIDVTASISVDVLLTSLIKKELLPSVRLWITGTASANQKIHSDFVDMVTEVRGFTDPRKEEYFRKRFRDEQANTIIFHIKTSQSLHIMCNIPVFCWITYTVLEDVLKTREGGELPKTLTEIYAEFLKFHIDQTNKKYDQEKCIKCIKSLAKLAFRQLEKGYLRDHNLTIFEKDLKESGIDVSGASVCSGVFTEIFEEKRGWKNEDKRFRFVHLSVQAFLAALHVEMEVINRNKNAWAGQTRGEQMRMFLGKTSTTKVHRFAIYKALKSPNGHLDLFLRFLLGLSLETNQTLLQGLMTQTGSSSKTNQKTVEYIKKKISKNPFPKRHKNLLLCLKELNDHSLVEEIH